MADLLVPRVEDDPYGPDVRHGLDEVLNEHHEVLEPLDQLLEQVVTSQCLVPQETDEVADVHRDFLGVPATCEGVSTAGVVWMCPGDTLTCVLVGPDVESRDGRCRGSTLVLEVLPLPF